MFFFQDDLPIFYAGRAHRAGVFHLAFLAAPAFFQIHRRDSLAYDAQVVEIRLDAVVGAAAHGNFELMRQFDVCIPLIEALVNLLRERKCIDEPILAGRPLAPSPSA